MKLVMLGTGNAAVTACYNTCFVLTEGGKYFLVDGGGGNGVLRQLKGAGIDWKQIGDIFVTHKHIDHLMGIIWMLRMILQNMDRNNYEGQVRLYAHQELIALLKTQAELLLTKKETRFIGEGLLLIPLANGESHEIIGHETAFFDIESNKAKQFGFCMRLNGQERLCCCGDEPYKPCEEKYAKGSKWMMHEAFCLRAQADIFKPYEKDHSTVVDACACAEELGVENLILYHTEDKNIAQRKELYTREGSPFFHGKLYVPEDLETIEL